MISAKGQLILPSPPSIYVLIALALTTSIACSHGATIEHTHLLADVVEKLLIVASFASFASIGGLCVAAQFSAQSTARTSMLAAPLAQSQSDRPIVGLRVWRAITRGRRAPVLQSWLAQHALWPRGRELTAEPASPGIHAFKSAAALLEYVGSDITSARTVVGTVALWGTVIEHEAGWTAEKAYPLEIHCANADVAMAVRRVYGCETAWAPDGLANAVVRLEARLREPESPSV